MPKEGGFVERNAMFWKNNQESYTGKTSRHVACGYAHKVWSDGEASDTKFHRSEDAVEEFLKAILQSEKI